jgi:glycosyltransferase involved in cell wall biosynthesis|tara:strand:+ start:3480 stop:4634 length:1155 start_codon:yes stop_codon:yes gene_type:complete
MSANKKSIFVWSPFISKVGTVQNVINSSYSINKYSKFNTNLINAFGEWDNYIEDPNLDKVVIYNFRFLRFIKHYDKTGFLKSRFSYLLIFIFSFFPLLNLIRKQKPDFLIVHLISSLPLIIFDLFNFKTKLILHIAGHPKLNFFRKMLWKISSKNIFKVICPSNELKKAFLDNDIFDEEQIKVIEDPHLVIKKINRLKKQELEDSFFHGSRILIAIGRMTKQKNYSFLIKNFEKLTFKYTDIKLIIIGDGEEKNNLQNLIKELNITNKVKLIDYELNIYKYLKKSSYYISTSIWEGSSLAMVDAAYVGVPILCSDCPSGRKEFIGKNERGFLYKQNDSKDFLNSFADMYSSKSIDMHKILISAKRRTKRFTLFKSFSELCKILN